jgi:hypothetical protein
MPIAATSRACGSNTGALTDAAPASRSSAVLAKPCARVCCNAMRSSSPSVMVKSVNRDSGPSSAAVAASGVGGS